MIKFIYFRCTIREWTSNFDIRFSFLLKPEWTDVGINVDTGM